jgi:hypothetical protein
MVAFVKSTGPGLEEVGTGLAITHCCNARRDITPLALEGAGGFNRAELNTIAKLVQEHRETLLERWYEFFGR